MAAHPFRGDLCLVPHAVNTESATIALRWIRNLPTNAWSPVNCRARDNSRIKFSRRTFYGEAASWDKRVPPELLALGREATESARLRVPDAPWDIFEIDTLVINRYSKGKGVAKHKDPPKWVPLVVGVTLYDDPYGPVSAMQFENGNPLDRLQLSTPHRSAYVFHGRAYTDATHARKPGAARQTGYLYSFTFRAYAP